MKRLFNELRIMKLPLMVLAFWLLVLFLSCLLCSSAFAQEVEAKENSLNYKLVRTTQLETLNRNSIQIDSRLEMVEMQLSLLKTPSKQLVKELGEARNLLSKTMNELQKSNDSLESAEKSITILEGLCSQLENKLQLERETYEAKLRKHKWQKLLYFLGGAVVGAVVK